MTMLWDADTFTVPPAATETRLIVQLCADTGSDTWAYRSDPRYRVVTVGADIGVENYTPLGRVHGIIANPVCTEFSPARYGNTFGGGARPPSNPEDGMWLVRECLRVIEEAQPEWWALENPATGQLRKFLGKPHRTVGEVQRTTAAVHAVGGRTKGPHLRAPWPQTIDRVPAQVRVPSDPRVPGFRDAGTNHGC